MLNRRQFLAYTLAAGAALGVPWYFTTGEVFAFYQSTRLRKFVQPLRGVGPGGIPVAAPDAFPAPVTGVTHYSFTIAQFTDQLHPNLGPTTLWGYNPAVALVAEFSPRGTSAASSWRSEGYRFSSPLPIHCHRSISCRSTRAPTSLMQGSARTRPSRTYMVG